MKYIIIFAIGVACGAYAHSYLDTHIVRPEVPKTISL